MPASLDDLLTTQKNGVVGVNNISQTWQRGQGSLTSATVTGDTLVIAGKGYLVNFSVLNAGSGAGYIYNANSVASISASSALCVTPTVVGVFPAGQVFSNGIVISPGTGQSINVTYSVG